jgi:hypothetical protein
MTAGSRPVRGTRLRERFVSEPIHPLEEAFDLAGTPIGEPPLPCRFNWRGAEYTFAEVLERRRTATANSTRANTGSASAPPPAKP